MRAACKQPSHAACCPTPHPTRPQYWNKHGELVTEALGNVGTNKTLAAQQAMKIAIPSAAKAFDH